MKRLLSVLLALSLTACSSYSQSAATRDSLYSEIDANLPSGTGAVTAAQLRSTLKDITASAFIPQSDSGGLTSADGNLTLSGTFPNQVITFTGTTGGGSGDMLKSTYDTNHDNIVDVAALANSVSWANVSSKPTIDQLLPGQSGKSGYFLQSNGFTASWAAAPTGGGGGGSGDMLKSIYDSNNDGVVDAAATANSVNWVNVTSKPTFAASATTDTTVADNIGSGHIPTGRFGNATVPLTALNASGTISGSNVLTGTGWAAISGATDNTRRTITQTAHGLTPKTVVLYNGTAWVPAVATSTSAAEASAIIESVPDANTFVAVFDGLFTPTGGGLTPGANYYVDATTPGNITSTEPLSAGQVGKPVMQAISSTQAVVHLERSLQTDNQAQNLVFASPVGSTGAPDWRALVAADLPANSADQVLPGQSGNSGKFLKSNGTTTSWATAGTSTINQWTADQANLPAANAASATTINSIHALLYPKTGVTTPGAFFVGNIPQNTSIPFGFHVVLHFLATTNTGDVRWSVQIENMNIHVETSDNWQSANSTSTTVNSSAEKGNTTTFNIGAIPSLDSVSAGSIYRVLVQRVNGSGLDTCTGDVQLLTVEVQAY